MGYRVYIGQIKKEDFDKNKIMNEDGYKRKVTEELYEIGKYYSATEFEDFEIIHDCSDEDTEYYVITRESLLAIIKECHKDISTYYTNLYEQKKNEYGRLVTYEEHIKEMRWEWCNGSVNPYNLNLTDPEVVGSWKKEYNIFEFVKIYKAFNPETHYLVYRGY